MSSFSPPPPNNGALRSSFDRLPDELVVAVFEVVALLDPKTMMSVVHAVCRRWRQVCGETHSVHLDFTFLPRNARLRRPPTDAAAEAAMVASLTALAGRFKHVVECNSDGVLRHTSADRYAIALIEHCPQLTNVNFHWCNQLTDASVVALAEHCPLLTNVKVRCCFNLTDVSVVALAEHCPQLTNVDFDCCHQLTDTSVVALADHCPQLTHVNFGRCDRLTDTSVVELAEHCPQLTHVNFYDCIQLTDTSVVALAEHCPKITTGTNLPSVSSAFMF
jgi:hypothetical protein